MNNNQSEPEASGESRSSFSSTTPVTVLLALNWTRDKDPRLPLGHASILATLRKEGREVEPLVIPVNPEPLVRDLVNRILRICARYPVRPIDLAIGVYCWGKASVKQMLPLLRQQGFKGRIILGGPEISYREKGFEKLYPEADVFVLGYGEKPMLALSESTQRRPIHGVHYACNKDPLTRSLTNLELLPSPWLSHDWSEEPIKFVRWETTRGCQYQCSFCQHRAPGNRPRVEKIADGRIRQEIRLFCDRGVESIAVLDPVFNTPKSLSILQTFIDCGYQGELSLQCRPERITTDFLNMASKLDVILEFGLQTVHLKEMDAIGRRNDLNRVDLALREVRSRGIRHEVSLIFGLPEQTLESFKATVQWCLERKVQVLRAFPLMLLPGTSLEVEADKWGLKESYDEIPVVISSHTFTYEDWMQMNGLSEALKETEGRHSSSIEQLLGGVGDGSDDRERWSPRQIVESMDLPVAPLTLAGRASFRTTVPA